MERMNLFVDCDETLVFWENPLLPYQGDLILNVALVDVLTEGIEKGFYKVTIWSAGGKYWAEQVNGILFGEYNLPSASKWQMFDKIPENSYAIDDRKQEDREYLQRFVEVFSPEEFIQNAEIFKKNPEWLTE